MLYCIQYFQIISLERDTKHDRAYHNNNFHRFTTDKRTTNIQ